jgi:hypothetical protein
MNQITILAIFAILAGSVTFATIGSTIVESVVAQTMDNATMAGNMTGANMTAGGGNTTEATGQISGKSR